MLFAPGLGMRAYRGPRGQLRNVAMRPTGKLFGVLFSGLRFRPLAALVL